MRNGATKVFRWFTGMVSPDKGVSPYLIGRSPFGVGSKHPHYTTHNETLLANLDEHGSMERAFRQEGDDGDDDDQQPHHPVDIEFKMEPAAESESESVSCTTESDEALGDMRGSVKSTVDFFVLPNAPPPPWCSKSAPKLEDDMDLTPHGATVLPRLQSSSLATVADSKKDIVGVARALDTVAPVGKPLKKLARAKRACQPCHSRKVRCVTVDGSACCTRCVAHPSLCVPFVAPARVPRKPTTPKATSRRKVVPKGRFPLRKRLADELNVHRGLPCRRNELCDRPHKHPGHCRISRTSADPVPTNKRKQRRRVLKASK